ncbi:type IV pilus modification PilV family protein [Paludisphaera mucosa]|uniref:Prepilin-type N-terminal cleavage/methylation domain-containing protein n=1 Tax=Paludisphaera mucosa TaxID=3030827 RepID=A0ABT6F6X0_9BACT|nr:hypothetical protein [Paludisphaera mucosa]MDG3003327.1 hypothetical protein [Paludisphaera mucosa]
MTTRRAARAATIRSGITLTELLISVLILGIGLVSLATLFPIGLVRLREAQRYSRSAILSQSAGADLLSRGLLKKSTFLDPNQSPWYGAGNVPLAYDPWIQDTPFAFGDWSGGNDITKAGAYRGYGGLGALGVNEKSYNGGPLQYGAGLPVAYDPLWWHQQRLIPSSVPADNPAGEARFGDGSMLGLADTSGGGAVASAWGLQRLTNLNYALPLQSNIILSTFISPEDIVWQETNNTGYQDLFDPTVAMPSEVVSPSPVIPDLATAAMATRENMIANGTPPAELANYAALTNDWRYTWMFVGQQADAFNDRLFNGNVVIFENRPFGFDSQLNQVAGERTVQAVFGYSSIRRTVGTMFDDTVVGVSAGADNVVLLLWPSTTPDLEIKMGSWVADVTYERLQPLAISRFQFKTSTGERQPPAQRCFWYQVQRATPAADTAGTPFAAFGNGRYSLVYTRTKLQAKTLWDMANDVPYHVNVAMVSPYVVGVVPRTFVMP